MKIHSITHESVNSRLLSRIEKESIVEIYDAELIFANRFTKIHKDWQKDSQKFVNLFDNLCESLWIGSQILDSDMT